MKNALPSWRAFKKDITMTPYQILSEDKEACPEWLMKLTPGSTFERSDFFKSRVVFYPGSGHDGHAVKLFGSTHAAHCFVYADYLIEVSEITASLDRPKLNHTEHFNGYHTLVRITLSPESIIPAGLKPLRPDQEWAKPRIKPYGFLEVLERDQGLTDEHGANRLAILFLGADGHATYDALFCQANGTPSPFAVFIQDHGFGGNYSPFGHGGLMEEIAITTQVWPHWLVVAENSSAWEQYEPMPDVDADRGGMQGNRRRLYQRRQFSLH
jgi:hypothetical protein